MGGCDPPAGYRERGVLGDSGVRGDKGCLKLGDSGVRGLRGNCRRGELGVGGVGCSCDILIDLKVG